MKKKLVSILLCACMTVSLLAGCGNGSSGGDDGAAAGAGGSADAAEAGNSGEIVDIVMPMATLGEAPAKLEEVEAKINEITEAKIGVHLIIEPVPFGDLASQQTLMISSGDQIDLVLSLWQGGIGSYVEKGAVIELTDLVEQYGQDILESVGPSIAGGYYDGTLYAVPNAELQGHSYGFMARKDEVDELFPDFEPGKTYTVEDLEELFSAYKEKYGEGYYCIAGTSSNSEFFGYLYGHPDNTGCGNTGFACGGLIDCLDKSDTTIQNVYATDEYMDYANKMYEWAQKGYFSADAATNTDSGTAQIASGNYLGQFNTADEPALAQYSSACGTEVVQIKLMDAYAATGMYQAVIWGISSNCENPEKAMQMLNLLYSDAEVVTLLMYGMEGESYEVVEQGEGYQKVVDFPEGVDAMNSPYYVTLGVFGNQNLYPVWAPDTMEHYEQMSTFNAYVNQEAQQSVALRYAFNYSSLATEYSAVSAVLSQYQGAIACGSVDPATQIPAFVKALEDAGINDLVAANQEQLDAWLAENK